MIRKEKLFGIVVWFNPTQENINATQSYVNEVAKLIIVDNSSVDNSCLLNRFPSADILYLPNKKNLGVATALNQGCLSAMENGAEWVLTMDQDSHFNENGVSELVEKANAYQFFDRTAIFSPVHHFDNKANNKRKYKGEYTQEHSVMTSGNLLSLAAYRRLGRFKDEFFIDLVDDEFCYRANEKGFLVVTVNTVLLHHYVGRACAIKFFGLKKTFDDHPPFRQYYMARNALYMVQLYPKHKKAFRRCFWKRLKRLVLYDNRNKKLKLRFLLKGVSDYRKGITGPLTTRNF